MNISLLQSITKDWEHADFELLKKSVNALPASQLNSVFGMFEFTCTIAQNVISPQDPYGLGFSLDFEQKTSNGIKLRSVSDNFRYLSVNPQFPLTLRSTIFGRPKGKPLPSPVIETDVLLAIGDSDISARAEDDDGTILKKISFERFKISRNSPTNAGNISCRFGRLLSYKDAIEQFELLVTLPIVLIDVTAQDLLQLTDLKSIEHQVSPMSTPDRKIKTPLDSFAYRSPLRLATPDSSPARGGALRMDLRDRLPGSEGGPAATNESTFTRGINLDMRSRFASQIGEMHDAKVSPNRTFHSIKSRMAMSPQSMPPPLVTADMKEERMKTAPGPLTFDLSEKPPLSSSSHSGPVKSINDAAAMIPAKGGAIGSSAETAAAPKVVNPFFNPSPKSVKNIPNQQVKTSRIEMTTTDTTESTLDTGNIKSNPVLLKDSTIALLLKVFTGILIVAVSCLLLYNLSQMLSAPQGPVFSEKPIGPFKPARIFEDAVKGFKGVLGPDIVVT